MDNDQHEIEQRLLPFQEACRREGFDVQIHLVPIPNTADYEPFKSMPIHFQFKVIEPGIRGRHYLDTWIGFRGLLRETVDWSIRKRLRDFNIYPSLEASRLPLPPVPHQETTELFHRFLHILHWVFTDIRHSCSEDGKTMRAIYEIADAFHNLPNEMLRWGYGNGDVPFSTLESVYWELEWLYEKQQKRREAGELESGMHSCFYMDILEMPYEQFVSERLAHHNGRQTGIIFNPDRSANDNDVHHILPVTKVTG